MNRIETIRSSPLLMIDGINFGRVIISEAYDTTYKAYFKHLSKLFLTNFKMEKNTKDDSTVFFYSLLHAKRTDYDEIMNYFLKIFPNFSSLLSIRFYSFDKFFSKSINLLKCFLLFKKQDLPTPFLCAVLTTEYLTLYHILKEEIKSNPALLITFCDAHPEDNLITQIMNSPNTKTATLQHGQYRILDERLVNADAEAYKNFISNYLFAWGDATKDEFVRYGIDTHRIISVGALKKYSFIKKAIRHANMSVFGVVLSGDTYRNSNIEMIKIANCIAKKYNLKYFLRFHPRNKINTYLKFVNSDYLSGYSNAISNNEYISKIDFSIIHMTGVFVELLAYNSIIFVYKDIFLEKIFEIDNFTFFDLNTFSNAYDYYKNNPENTHAEQYKSYDYFNKVGIISNYKKAIKKIMS